MKSIRNLSAPGMMLEMDNSELLILLDSESQLKAKAQPKLLLCYIDVMFYVISIHTIYYTIQYTMPVQ